MGGVQKAQGADWSCAGVVASREAPKGLPVGVGTSTKDGTSVLTLDYENECP